MKRPPGEPDAPALLVVTGPVGVGKTTTGAQVSTLLAERGVPNTFVDFDALSETWPTRPGDRFNQELARANLRDVWRNAAAFGSRNLIVAAVIEKRAECDAMASAVGACTAVLAGLQAPVATLEQRVRRRDLVARERDWSLARTRELAAQLDRDNPADFVLDTEGRDPTEIAAELVALVDWRD